MPGSDVSAGPRRGSMQLQNSAATPAHKLSRLFSRNRSSSLTDSMIRGVLAGFPKKESAKHRFLVDAVLPDGGTTKLTGENGMRVRDLLASVVMEYKLTSYRVRMSASRAVLNLDVDALLLENEHITIEDIEKEDHIDPHIVKDSRLWLVYKLLKSEQEYYESLKSIFDVYADPLRKFSSMGAEDHRVLFFGLEPLISLSHTLCTKLEDVMHNWDPGITTVGNFFSKQFWQHYNEYYFSYPVIRELLKEKKLEEEFVEFCRLRRGAAIHSLESLLLLPVQRIPQYEHYLTELLAQTNQSHPDYEDLTKAAQKVAKMVKEREDEVNCMENENKVDSVQERFPNDDLQLNDKDKQAVRPKNLHMRRRSAPNAVLLKSLGGSKSKNSLIGSGLGNSLTTENNNAENKSSSRANRIYVLEGPVQLNAGLQNQDRYFFLFNDLLLVAKQRSSTTFKLKNRIRVCELWTATCVEDVCETTRDRDKSFVLGWPTNNVVVTFSTTELKELWLSKLKEQISLEKEKESPKTFALKVINKDMDFTTSKSLLIRNSEESHEILKRCFEEFRITEGERNDYQLWVVAGKEETPYPLIGHEHPYSICMNQVRNLNRMDSGDMVIPLDVESMDTSVGQPQFVLCHSKKLASKHSSDESTTKRKKSKKYPFTNLFKRNNTQKEDVSGSSPSLGRLFGQSLSDICEEDSLCKPVMDMLQYVFANGPYTTGIFRKSANQRVCKEIRQQLDVGFEQTYEEVPVLVVGAVLKDYLRSLPDSLLLSSLYDQWMDTLEISDNRDRIDKIKKIMENLSKSHQQLLRYLMCVLYHIDKKSADNNMNAYNLAVCVGPSLIWSPLNSSICQAEASKKVLSFVQYMIEHVAEIFGEETLGLFGEPVTPKNRQDSSTDSDSMHSLLGIHDHTGLMRRDDSSLDSLERELYNGDMEYSPHLTKSHLSPTNLSRDSGLTLSDTQLDDHENDNDMMSNEDRRKLLARSVSQVDQTPEKHQNKALSSSYPESLKGAPPVPPPRKNRRRGSEPPQSYNEMRRRRNFPNSMQTDIERAPLRHGSLTHNMSDGELQKLRDVVSNNRISAESLESVEEDAEPSELTNEDFNRYLKSRCQDMGILTKSASGARLYMNEELLHSQWGPDDRRVLEHADSFQSQESTPPVSPYSANSLDMSSDSVESSKAFSPVLLSYHDSLRQNRSPRLPVAYNHVRCESDPPSSSQADTKPTFSHQQRNEPVRSGLQLDTNLTYSPQHRNGPVRVSPQPDHRPTYSPQHRNETLHASYPGTSEVAMETDSVSNNRHGNTLKEENKHYQMLNSNQDVLLVNGDVLCPPKRQTHSTQSVLTSSAYGTVTVSAPAHTKVHVTMSAPTCVQSVTPHISQNSGNIVKNNNIPPPRSSSPQPPVPKSRPSLRHSASLDYKNADKATLKRARAGMTAKGADLYPSLAVQTIYRHSLHNQDCGTAEGGSPVVRRAMNKTQPRPYSSDCSSNYNVPQHKPQNSERSSGMTSAARGLQRPNSVHLGNAEHQRPSQPPSYQEAMQRKSLLKSNISDEDRIKQTVISARARQLYQESMRQYQAEQHSGDVYTDVESLPLKQQPTKAQIERSLRKVSDTQLMKGRKVSELMEWEGSGRREISLHRSKSDSPEHINKLGHVRNMTAMSVQERPTDRHSHKQHNFDSWDARDSGNHRNLAMFYQPYRDNMQDSQSATSNTRGPAREYTNDSEQVHKRSLMQSGEHFKESSSSLSSSSSSSSKSSPKRGSIKRNAVIYIREGPRNSGDFSQTRPNYDSQNTASNHDCNKNTHPAYRTQVCDSQNAGRSVPEYPARNLRRGRSEITYV